MPVRQLDSEDRLAGIGQLSEPARCIAGSESDQGVDSNASDLQATAMPHTYRRLVMVRELVRERYAEPAPLRVLSAAAGLSEYHLLRAYRSAFGETPHQHAVRLRIEHAKRLLASGASVTEACFDAGYSSLGSFSSLFAHATGQSPRAWQREVRALVTVPQDLPRLYIPGCFLAFFADPAPVLVQSKIREA